MTKIPLKQPTAFVQLGDTNHQDMARSEPGEPAINGRHLLLRLIPMFLAEYPVMLPHIDYITMSLYMLFGMPV